MKFERGLYIQKIAVVALMMGLAAVLKMAGYMVQLDFGQLRFAFFAIPILLSGIITDWRFGAVCGLGADLIYGLFLSAFPFNIVYTISAIMWGIAGGFLGFLIRNSFIREKTLTGYVAFGLVVLVMSFLETNFNAIFDFLLYKKEVVILALMVKYLALLIKWPIIVIVTKMTVDAVSRLNMPLFRIYPKHETLNKTKEIICQTK